MNERPCHKLVRDNIPAIIRQQGETPITRTLDSQEYARCLEEKLREEVEEFLAEPSLHELGDILEVLEAIARLQGWPSEAVRQAKEDKARRSGAFRHRVFLEKSFRRDERMYLPKTSQQTLLSEPLRFCAGALFCSRRGSSPGQNRLWKVKWLYTFCPFGDPAEKHRRFLPNRKKEQKSDGKSRENE